MQVRALNYPVWDGGEQYLYFSDTGDHMFEILSYNRFTIYKREKYDFVESNRVHWVQFKRIHNIPKDFLNSTQHPFYLSPDFMWYLDIQKIGDTNAFVIRDNKSSSVHQIPQELMNYNEGIASVANRFRWHDNNSIRIINTEGIERIIKLEKVMTEIQGVKKLNIKYTEVQFHVIPLYNHQWCSKHHYYFNDPSIELDSVEERLKRKYQAYKQAKLYEENYIPSMLNSSLVSVDYKILSGSEASDETSLDRHVIDQSFTFLHWNLIEQLLNGTLSISQINLEQLKCLIYNIFPDGNTILHLLGGKSDIIQKIYEQCHYYSNEEKRLKARYHIPFVKNIIGETPMDLLKKKEDRIHMDMMLLNLSPYWLDHHSRELQHMFENFIADQLPNLNVYLQSRVIQTKALQAIDKGIIQGDLGIDVASFWINNAEQQSVVKSLEELKETEGQKEEDKIDVEVRVDFIDIASLHTYSYMGKEGQSIQFFKALADCQNYELFEQFAIQKLIEYKWPLTFEYILKKLLIPYLALMVVYLVYSNWFYQIRMNEPLWMNYCFISVLVGLSCYFIYLEKKQIEKEGLKYLSNFWNYFDMIAPCTLIVFLILEVLGMFNYTDEANQFIAEQRMRNLFGQTVEDPTINIRTLEGILQSVLSLILWLKLLYFLRIFKSTGYYIRIIVEVIKEMRYFLFMLLLTFLAFGDSMRQISTSNTEKQDFIGGTFFSSIAFIYRIVLGDFDTNSFGEVAVVYVWILFVLCTVLNMIIMMNLLIAIISESFANINSNSNQASYQEKAIIINESNHLIPETRKINFSSEKKYLIVATDTQQELEQPLQIEDQVEQVIERIGDRTREAETKLKQQMQETQKFSKALISQNVLAVNEQKEEIFKLISEIDKQLNG